MLGGKYEITPKIHPGRIAAPPLGVWVKDGQSYYQKDVDRQFFCWEIDTQEYSVRGIVYGTLMSNSGGPGWYVAGQEVGELLTNICKFLEKSEEALPVIDKYRHKMLIPIGLLGELAAAIEKEEKERNPK
jgi:hypothetical protein